MNRSENDIFASAPFRSFWMGGFECTDKLNAFGNRVDFLTLTNHLESIDEDYQNLAQFKIRTVREGIRWSQIEKSPFVYDWSVVARQIESAQAHDVQQVWDICHFGFPDDLTPLHPMFARRFAAVCRAFAVFFRSVDAHSPLIVTPINEVGFLSWLGGDVRGTSPYCVGQGWEVKYRLMKAYIEGVEALKEVDAGVRILTTEPLVNITHGLEASRAEKADARCAHEHQFQVLDILGGRMCPELRGRPEYLDLLGFNFYYNNQWVRGTNEMLIWKNSDPRWVPLHQLFEQTFRRYQRPVGAGGKFYQAPTKWDLEILDRVGGGDSFASGLIYGFLTFNDPQKAVDYGAAHGALVMTTPGDTSMATLKEVEAVVQGASARVQR